MENYSIKINDYPVEYGEVELDFTITDEGKRCYDKGFKAGMEEAWDLAGELLEFPCSDLEDIFSITVLDESEIFEELTVEEAKKGLEKYRRKQKCKRCNWYESQDAQWPTGCPCDSCIDGRNFTEKTYPEYHVGDEIEDDRTICVITHVATQTNVSVIYSYKGETGNGYIGYVNPRDFTKTGKTYPDIEKIINELGR